MPYVRRFLRSAGFLAALLSTAGCAYQTAAQRLSLPEQVEWRIYRQEMTSAQAHTYLAKTTLAERTTYLRDLGLVQRFEAFHPLDRDAILAGYPRQGMSAAALHFLWGPPYYTAGRVNYYEHWYYLGSSLALTASGNDYHSFGNRVVVHLDDGRVASWLDFVPTTDDSADDWAE